MSRFTGPRLKKMRALGLDLPGLSRKSIERRPYPPGMHGGGRRRKESTYARQLKEKQKLRFNYGISEKQLRRVVVAARRSKTDTGRKILELLERRLDNVVFRAGYAPTIPAARQLVNHGHFLINGRKCDIASASLKGGDVLALRPKSHKIQIVIDTLASPSLVRPDWIDVDATKFESKLSSTPDENSIPIPIDVQLVVEYYARQL